MELSRSSLRAGTPLKVSVTVRNTGGRDGAEVVQIYVADKEASVARPPKELKAFGKVFLKAGESRKVSFTLDADAFSWFDAGAHAWVAEPGEFEILAGSSSADVRSAATVKLL